MMKRAEVAFGIRRCRTWLVVPAVLLSFGCGGPKGDVSGTVTYQGKPLPSGTVTFFGAEEKVVGTSPISDQGNYSMTKVPAGPVRIAVTAPTIFIPDPKAPEVPRLTGKEKKPKEIEKRMYESMRNSTRLDIPTKYGMPEQSGLTYTVQPGQQEHPIDLK